MGGEVSFYVNKRLGRLSNDDLLLHACKAGNTAQVQHHLQNGPCLDVNGKKREKALRLIIHGRLPPDLKNRLLEHLFKNGANGFVPMSRHGTYLHHMVRSLSKTNITKEDLTLINKCLATASDGTDFDVKDKEGFTVFHLCCRIFSIAIDEPTHAILDTLNNFLLHGCDINAENKAGDTCMHTVLTIPLYYTAVKIIQFLLSKGADVSRLNKDGQCPLYSLHKYSHILSTAKGVHAVDLQLLKAGANPNQVSEGSSVPISPVIEKVLYLMTIRPPVDLVTHGYPWMYCNFKPFDRILQLVLHHLQAGLNVKNLQATQLASFVRWMWQKADQINSGCDESIDLLCQCLQQLQRHGYSELVHRKRPLSPKTDALLDSISKEFVTLQELSVYVIRVSLKPNAFVGVRHLDAPTAIKEIIGLIDCKVTSIGDNSNDD